MLEVMGGSATDIDNIKQAVSAVTAGRAGVYDWRDSNSSFFTALQVERNVMFLILTMIILVAAFNIISSMIMLVKDKGRDIAIMRTMGASARVDDEDIHADRGECRYFRHDCRDCSWGSVCR